MQRISNLSMIAAIGNNNELGLKNQLLCHLPADLKYFKQTTGGHSVIMGDVTWYSLPKKPLPNRKNIVMTLDKTATFPGCEIAYSPEEAIALIGNDDEAFVMGGATIYSLFFNRASKLYITRILSDFEADVFFPKIEDTIWSLSEDLSFPKDEKNCFDLRFQKYILK